MRLSSKNTEAKYIPIWIACVLSLFLFFVSILLKFNGLYGQDAYKYLQYTKALTQYFHSGSIPEDIYFPILYPIIGSLLNVIIPGPALCLQLVSIISYCLGFILLERLIYLIYKPLNRRSINTYLIFFYVLSPYIFRFSLLVMSDMFAMFLCVAVFYFTIRYHQFDKPPDLYLTVLFFLVAGLTRNSSLTLLAIPMILILFRFIKNFRILNLFAILLIILVILLPDYLLRHRFFIFSELNGQFNLSYMAEKPNWSVLNWFKYSFHGINGYQSYHQPNIIFVLYNFFHPAYLFCGIAFLFFLKKKDFATSVSKWLLFSMLIYALFLAGFDSQNMRFLILSSPLVLVLLYPAFERFTEFLNRKKLFNVAAIFIFICQVVFTGYSFASVYKANKNDRDIVNILRAYPGKTIYAFEVDGIVQAYDLNNKPVNIWYKPLATIQPNSLLVLNPDKIKTQFKGQIVDQNLGFIFKNCHPVLIQSFKDGINLYQLNP